MVVNGNKLIAVVGACKENRITGHGGWGGRREKGGECGVCGEENGLYIEDERR